jgi:putative DNA primase/helicase
MTLCCAHTNKNPSLSISEGTGGQILLKCFAGCSIEEITGALGLDVGDLFPERLEFSKGQAPRFTAHEILMASADEIQIAALLLTKWSDPNSDWSTEDHDRLMIANERIQNNVSFMRGVTWLTI